MREIKFRAWEFAHEFTNRPGWKDSPIVWKMNYEPEIWGGETFYEGDCVNLNKALANGGDAEYEKPNKSIFMQYTGLKDKKGREVYEGDLVAPNGGYEDGECEHPSEVHWNEYNLQWEALCKTCADAVPLAEFDLHSVVGNVWES